MMRDTISFSSVSPPPKSRPASPAPLAVTALLAFLCFVGWSTAWPTAVLVHLVLAVGALPLILASMGYFTPVLTRSGAVPGRVNLLPLLAMAAGGLGSMAVAGPFWLVGVAAPLAWLVAAALLWWMSRRAARALGSPHPGLLWYQAALVCLLLGLSAILATLVWPEQWGLLRTLHRHLNLLGLVGLTAIGTLQVLLPTVGGYPDPQAGARLHQDLKYALAGVLLMTAGTVLGSWLGWLGLGAWTWVLGRLLRPLSGQVGRLWQANGAALSLLAALGGFVLSLLSITWGEGSVALPLFLALFLFPLVAGALAHLLPLWWWPGLPTPQRHTAQQQLGRWALLRVGLSWLGGGALLAGAEWGVYPVATPMLLLLGQVVWLGRQRGNV
ncbi:MAG: hypothetical protein H7838_02695 [Magnetococcus sp. DMHC-8]